MRSGFKKLTIAVGILTFWMQPLAGLSANDPTPAVTITSILPQDASVTLSAMATDEDIVLSIKPAKMTFVQNEPMLLNVVLSNRSSQVIEVFFAYPNEVGISFSCATAVQAASDRIDGDKRLPVLSIQSGKDHRFVLALNRYLTVENIGKHLVAYSAEYLEPVSEKKSHPQTFLLRGEFTVQIEEGGIGQADIDAFVKGIESQNVQYRREAIEGLLWIKSAKVIAPLRAAATIEPRYGAEIVKALGKLMPNTDARKALSEVVLDGDARCVRAFMKMSQDSHMSISEEEYRALLSSRNPSVRLAALENIVAVGSRNLLPLVRQVAEDNNPTIKKLASEFIERKQ